MKFINKYVAFVAIVAMLFSSCSKDEPGTASDDPNTQSVELTFSALLNDLANRAASVNKNHFDQIPDCSEAAPEVAVIGFSYGGNSYVTEVAILMDESGYFTDYSEDLKIPVGNNSSTQVTLDSFMVYDGDPDGDGNLIWIAPIETFDGQFDGYVENALPFDFDVSDGTKPYIDVEVLCYDRRMANEYGYVFFDIMPEVIYPLCLFVNYCDENGRHYVADYSIDLFYATGDDRVQLYDHTTAGAMASTGEYGVGEYYAEPLCLVVPGRVPNLATNLPYLYLVVYPEDWDGTGDIDNSPIGEIEITWDMVEGLLNDDGETNEYLHLLIGECEGALSGDGTGGNGGGTGNNDLDGDGVNNVDDLCPDTPPNTQVNAEGCPDEDGDGVADTEDVCPGTPAETAVDADGCPVDTGGGDPEFTCNFTAETGCLGWDFDQSEATSGIDPNSYDISVGGELIGLVTIMTDVDGNVTVNVAMDFGYLLDDVGVIIDDGTEQCRSNLGGSSEELFQFSGDYGDQTNVQIQINYCAV